MSDYRWVDRELFANSQIEVVYRDKYFLHFQDQGRNIFVMTKNKEKANSAKKNLNIIGLEEMGRRLDDIYVLIII